MTEEEAKTKWCPFARVVSGEPMQNGLNPQPALLVGWNRREMESLGHRKENMCIGSACMAWRVRSKQTLKSTTSDETRPVSAGMTYSSRDWVAMDVPDSAEGYCGLAGRA